MGKQNLNTDRSHHAEYFTLCQNLVKSNGFGDMCKNLLSDPYVLYLVTAAMFFNRSKIKIICAGCSKKQSYKFQPNPLGSFREDV